MPVVIEALRAVNVPVAVIADFDVLRERALLEQLYVGLGGNWGDIEADWNVVRAAIENMGVAPLVSATREQVEGVLDAAAARGAHLVRDDVERIRNATRVDDGWAIVKRGGAAVLPGGDASDRAVSLISTLAERGLFVVEVGELERWAPAVGGHGPGWVVEVLNQNLHTNPDFPALAWTRHIDDYLEG